MFSLSVWQWLCKKTQMYFLWPSSFIKVLIEFIKKGNCILKQIEMLLRFFLRSESNRMANKYLNFRQRILIDTLKLNDSITSGISFIIFFFAAAAVVVLTHIHHMQTKQRATTIDSFCRQTHFRTNSLQFSSIEIERHWKSDHKIHCKVAAVGVRYSFVQYPFHWRFTHIRSEETPRAAIVRRTLSNRINVGASPRKSEIKMEM